MKVVKWLFVVVVVLAVAVIGSGFLLPAKVHVERTTLIDARPATVYTVLNGFRQFNAWSPWADLDPDTKYTYEGPLTGVGARTTWHSENPNVGSGSQEIVEATPYTRIRNRLVFGDFDSENWATYTLAPEGEGTRVTWSYDADFKGNIGYRYVGLMMEKMLGPEYEKGLAKLKTFVETLPDDDFAGAQLEVVTVPATPIAFIPGEAGPDTVAQALGERYAKIVAFMMAAGLQEGGQPIAITREFDEATRFWKFDAALPLGQPCTAPPDGEIRCGTTYAGPAIRAVHVGPYAALEPTYKRLTAFRTVAGLEDHGNAWEQYISDPGSTPEPELVTHVYWPVR